MSDVIKATAIEMQGGDFTEVTGVTKEQLATALDGVSKYIETKTISFGEQAAEAFKNNKDVNDVSGECKFFDDGKHSVNFSGTRSKTFPIPGKKEVMTRPDVQTHLELGLKDAIKDGKKNAIETIKKAIAD